MDYFSKFLRTGGQTSPKPLIDHAQDFHKSWILVRNTLQQPDERQLTKGISSTDVPAHLRSMVDALVWESNRTEEGGTGACLEYLLKNDVLGTLVRLSETDRPSGIQAEVLRAVQNMVVLLDEQFLVHSAVHRAVLRLLRNCVGDDIQEQLDGRNKAMGAAGNVARSSPSEYEEDLVNLLCILCSRIRTYRELLMIFFHDKHWYRSEPLFSVEEEDEDEDEDEDDEDDLRGEPGVETLPSEQPKPDNRNPSPTPSQTAVASTSVVKKPEYEFLLFNYLLRFVHREGNIGEFARAGLLFLMDVAMSPGETETRPLDTNSSSNPPVSDPVNDAALALAEYILDGDFSEVLGAGLGAVYSLLPSKLGFFPQLSEDSSLGNGMTIGSTGLELEGEREKLEVVREKSLAIGIEDARSPDFQSRLDHFLKLLEFLQEVLGRNVTHDNVDASSLVGTAIVQSILDAVRRIFLENVLYPTILECSDSDGSAVAVMSYIEVMIRTLQDGPLADLFVDFLISEDNDDSRPRLRSHGMKTLGNGSNFPRTKSANDKHAKHRRRKSSAMTLLELEAPDSRRQSEYFTTMGRFTLKDLLLSNLRSKSLPTATSALQLLQSILIYRAQLCIERILLVIPDPMATTFPHPALIDLSIEPATVASSMEEGDDDDDDIFEYPGAPNDAAPGGLPSYSDISAYSQPDTTYSTHEREMGLYLTLISRVDPSHSGDVFSTGYDHYLRDALVSIQSQADYRTAIEETVDLGALQKSKHRLNVNDPILSLLLESLRRFFSNTPEFNIALTGVLATLAMHPHRSLAGWLTFATNDSSSFNGASGTKDAADDDGDDRSIDFRIEEKLSSDSSFLPAASIDENSRPVVHTVFHGLVSQLERYRQSVDSFDKFLLERRQGLLFSENLTDALTLALDIVEDTATVQSFELPQKLKPKPKATSSFVSFLTPKKSRPQKQAATPIASEPSTPQRKPGNKSVAASPFGPHYQQTSSIAVEPFIAPVPSSGPWTPAKSIRWNMEEDDVFTSSGWAEKARKPSEWDDDDDEDTSINDKSLKTEKTITLSQLLDNVVILEESIKELVAIIHARRSLGIDSLRYL